MNSSAQFTDIITFVLPNRVYYERFIIWIVIFGLQLYQLQKNKSIKEFNENLSILYY